MSDMARPVKVALSYDDQIEHFIDAHGLVIDDREEAIRILSNVNYYRLTGYGIALMDKATDRYACGTTIQNLYSLYQFDTRLRKLISPVIEYIEVSFRTKIAYHLALKYGPECYRDRSFFNPWVSGVTNRDMFDKFNEDVDEAIKRQAKNHSSYTMYKPMAVISRSGLSWKCFLLGHCQRSIR